jgi:hypothetical protein
MYFFAHLVLQNGQPMSGVYFPPSEQENEYACKSRLRLRQHEE